MGLKERENQRSVVGSLISAGADVGASAAPEAPVPAAPSTPDPSAFKEDLVQRGYYLRRDTLPKIKMEAAMTGMKDYQIVQAALDAYFEK